jgi:lactate permease
MFLYTMTVITGKFEIVKESIIHISFDRRLQVLLIAFSFGAIIEGTSGFGTPVAIAGAVMVGLGFKPFQSAVLNLLANTAPVAWGAIGTPIVTLAAVSGLDQLTLSAMAGHQLPFVSILVPFWLVATFVKMEGGTWKEVFEVWPAALWLGRLLRRDAVVRLRLGPTHLMTDVVSGVFSVICTALFLRFVWHPRRASCSSRSARPCKTAEDHRRTATWKYPYTVGQTVYAWLPWAILIACCAIWGMPNGRRRSTTSSPA